MRLTNYTNSYFLFFGLFFSVLFSSCKKQNGNFSNGYEYGENEPNASGGVEQIGKDFSKRNSAKIFPGLVADLEPRIVTNVVIDMNAAYVRSNDLKVIKTPEPMYSTGLYAPAGEPIEIEVPSGFEGLIAQIGGWTDNLTGTPVLARDPVIYNQVQLVHGKNIVRNLYGGTLYIKANNAKIGFGSVSLKISGAVKSPDFILGKSSNSEWNDLVKSSTVPWLQLVGKHIIFELPKHFIDKNPITNPSELLSEWDRFIEEDVYNWKGLKEQTTDSLNQAPVLPIRVIMDAQPQLTYAHNSYPIVLQMDENLFVNEIGNLQNLVSKGAWRTMSEIGRNNITINWRSTAIGELNNLFIFKYAHRKGINVSNIFPNIKSAVDTSMLYIRKTLQDVLTPNFTKDVAIYSNNHLIRLMPLIQLFEQYGYSMFSYMDQKARTIQRTSFSEQEKINFIYQAASEYAKKDLYLFFYQWGLLPTDAIREVVRTAYPLQLDKDIYNYNIILDTGGTRAAKPESKMISRVSWVITGFCCQESDARTTYASNVLDGDIRTYWHSQWVYNVGSNATYHLPHYMYFDMNRFYDVGGFWFANGHVWRPRTIRVYFSSDNKTWVPERGYQVTGKDNQGVYNEYRFDSVFKNVRYIKYEMVDVYTASENNACSTAEFGALKP